MASKEQKEIVAKNLEKLLKRKGKTQTDMARDLGFPEMTVSNWMKAKTYPRPDKLQLMADYFGVYRSEITEDTPNIIAEAQAQYLTGFSDYPYLPTTISAGLPLNVESIKSDDVEQIAIPDALMGKYAGSKDIYFMRVNGESMNNVMPDRSLIAVKSINLSSLKNGDIVVYSDGHDYSVKRFYRDGTRLIFRPDSKDDRFYDYITDINNQELVIHGKVVLYIVELD